MAEPISDYSRFHSDRPKLAAALLLSAVRGERRERLAEELSDMATDHETRQAFGWLECYRDCFFPPPSKPDPSGFFVNESAEPRGQFHIQDFRYVEQVLWGSGPPAAPRSWSDENDSEAEPMVFMPRRMLCAGDELAALAGCVEVFSNMPTHSAQFSTLTPAPAAAVLEKWKSDRWAEARQIAWKYDLHLPTEPVVTNQVDYRNAMDALRLWARDAAAESGNASGSDEAAPASLSFTAVAEARIETSPPGPPVPPDRFAEVREFAVVWKMKGDEYHVLRTLCENNGRVRLIDLGQVDELDWGVDLDENAGRFDGVARRVQSQKVPQTGQLTARSAAWGRSGWRLRRHDNAAILERTEPTDAAKAN